MLLHELVYFAREWIGTQPQIVGFDVVFLSQLIPALDHRPVRGSISNEADLRLAVGHHLWTRHEGTRSLELPVNALHIFFKIIGPLAVLRFLVMPAPAGKIRGGRMVCPRKGSITYAISIHVFVTGKIPHAIK